MGERSVVPSVNQIELHPNFQQAETRAFDTEHGIATEAWSPSDMARAYSRIRPSPRSPPSTVGRRLRSSCADTFSSATSSSRSRSRRPVSSKTSTSSALNSTTRTFGPSSASTAAPVRVRTRPRSAWSDPGVPFLRTVRRDGTAARGGGCPPGNAQGRTRPARPTCCSSTVARSGHGLHRDQVHAWGSTGDRAPTTGPQSPRPTTRLPTSAVRGVRRAGIYGDLVIVSEARRRAGESPRLHGGRPPRLARQETDRFGPLRGGMPAAHLRGRVPGKKSSLPSAHPSKGASRPAPDEQGRR